MDEKPAEAPQAKPRRRSSRIIVVGGGILLTLLVGAFVFMKVFHSHWNLTGGLRPNFDFRSAEAQFKKVEESRKQQERQTTLNPAHIVSAEASWPSIRGPRRDGISDEKGLLQKWPAAGPREIYREPIGKGFAGFVIGGGRAYTIEQRRKGEAVTCYDFATGVELWAHTYDAFFAEQLGGDGPRATPTLDGDRLYSLGAEGNFVCLDAATGKPKWEFNLLSTTGDSNLTWGMSGSPLIYDDKVVVTSGGIEGDSVHAFNKMDGKPIWHSVKEHQAYTSLMDVTLAGRRQVLNVSGGKANGIDPETGALLWSFPWITHNDINCAQPLVAGPNRVFLSSGYGTGCALFEVDRVEGRLQSKHLWANGQMKNKFNSSVLVNGFVYGLDEGILACLEVETGAKRWKGGRYGYGQLIFADGNLIVLCEDGALALVKASPESFVEISKFHSIEGKTWNIPALAGGRLLVRNDREMACYELKAEGTDRPAAEAVKPSAAPGY